jgi:hypothetical protein
LWPTELLIAQIATRLHRGAGSVEKMARKMGLPPKSTFKPKAGERVYWNPRKPFEATVVFLSGWLTVYGDLPTCAMCGQRVYRRQSALWIGGGPKARLAHETCARAKRKPATVVAAAS